MFFSAYFGVELPKLPTFDMESLLTYFLWALGLGGLRTFEKFKGITKMTCERCKVNMGETEIKGVYKCPILWCYR